MADISDTEKVATNPDDLRKSLVRATDIGGYFEDQHLPVPSRPNPDSEKDNVISRMGAEANQTPLRQSQTDLDIPVPDSWKINDKPHTDESNPAAQDKNPVPAEAPAATTLEPPKVPREPIPETPPWSGINVLTGEAPTLLSDKPKTPTLETQVATANPPAREPGIIDRIKTFFQGRK